MKWRRGGLAIAVFVTLGAAFPSSVLWSRLELLPSMADEQWLAEKSDIIFKGSVTKVESDPNSPYVHEWGPVGAKPLNFYFVAAFRVDRVYRGKVPEEPVLHFEADDCILFQPGENRVVFANIRQGKMTLAEECVGALGVSPLLGPKLEGADWSMQMEADFIAGLGDTDPAARILSLQRLGGLQLASSRPAIRREIEQSEGEERKWAVCAALRTGDTTVMPLVKDYLAATGERGTHKGVMCFGLRNIKDPAAVPDLLNIFANARDDATKENVLVALVDNIGDPRTIPALGESLSSTNDQILYLAVTGLGKIAHANACKISDADDDKTPFRQKVVACKAWWDASGSHEDWNQQ